MSSEPNPADNSEEKATPASTPPDTTSDSGRPRTIRSLLQFSLRSLMLLTILTAMGVSWWMQPTPEERSLPGGAKARVPVVERDQEPSVRHGRFVLLRKSGMVASRGKFERDLSTGIWKVYHRNGGRALRGAVDRDVRIGPWKAWRRSGVKQAEVRYADPPPLVQQAGKKGPTPVSSREGVASYWHENGQLASQGAYRWDRRHGMWTEWWEDGKTRSAGKYVGGRRHGVWNFFARDGQQTTSLFVHDWKATSDDSPAERAQAALRRVRAKQVGWRREMELFSALGSEGADLLAKVAEHEDRVVRDLAIRTLAAMGEHGAARLSVLQPLLGSSDERERVVALICRYCLSETERSGAFREIAQLADRTPTRRRECLKTMQDSPVLDFEQLTVALEDEDPIVRRFSCDLLGLVMLSTRGAADDGRDWPSAATRALQQGVTSERRDIAQASKRLLDVPRGRPFINRGGFSGFGGTMF